eukprot:CCRYP_021124-RA/>CCRYP_021124-RA protein AED:0.13 eAED:0.53 QI:0/0/0.5/1/1/1/2/190/860
MDDSRDENGRSGVVVGNDSDHSSKAQEERRKRRKEKKKRKREKKSRSSTFNDSNCTEVWADPNTAADAAQDGGAVDGTASGRNGEENCASVDERPNSSSKSSRYWEEDQEGMRRRRHTSSNEAVHFRLHHYDEETNDTAEKDLFQENYCDVEGKGNGVGGTIEIPHDSFSMLYAASDLRDYVLPTCTFIVQVMILVLICINLLQENDRPSNNVMNVPINVPLSVTISQYIACVVSILTADDFITGMLYIWKHIVFKDYSHINNHDLPPLSWKWELSNGMRIVEGALVIFTAFIFIVQSSTVIDLFLNFAGVTFVSMLDDTSFFLARHDFFGENANRLARRVTDLRAFDSARGRMVGRMRMGRYALFSCSTLAMWTVLSVFVHKQDQMDFACKTVIAQVADPKYAYFRHYSGSYSLVKDKRIGNRAMSERTRSFDISEVGGLQFWTGAASGIEILCADCNPKIDSTCSYGGICNAETRKCDCMGGVFGPRCQHMGPCTELIMQDSFQGSKTAPNQTYPKSFDLIYDENNAPMMWLNFPVYSQKSTSRYMLYDGGRWNVIHKIFNDDGDDGNHTDTDLLEYLQDYVTAYDLLYVSEPSNLVTPANLAFQAKFTDEEGLWEKEDDVFSDSTTVGRLGETQFYFSCADCIYDSEFGGISYCAATDGTASNDLCEIVESDLHGKVNRCRCQPGFMGPLCQIRPAEGKLLLFVDHDGSGVCRVCGDGNDWCFWELDGIDTTCMPFPQKPLLFQGTTGTFSRQLGLRLNDTHFSVFVSGDSTARGNNLCRPAASVKEIYSSMRNGGNEQIQHDYAIQLNNNESYFGEVIDPTGIECKTKTNVDQINCAVGLLSFAWIQLDLKVTPIN